MMEHDIGEVDGDWKIVYATLIEKFLDDSKIYLY